MGLAGVPSGAFQEGVSAWRQDQGGQCQTSVRVPKLAESRNLLMDGSGWVERSMIFEMNLNFAERYIYLVTRQTHMFRGLGGFMIDHRTQCTATFLRLPPYSPETLYLTRMDRHTSTCEQL